MLQKQECSTSAKLISRSLKIHRAPEHQTCASTFKKDLTHRTIAGQSFSD